MRLIKSIGPRKSRSLHFDLTFLTINKEERRSPILDGTKTGSADFFRISAPSTEVYHYSSYIFSMNLKMWLIRNRVCDADCVSWESEQEEKRTLPRDSINMILIRSVWTQVLTCLSTLFLSIDEVFLSLPRWRTGFSYLSHFNLPFLRKEKTTNERLKSLTCPFRQFKCAVFAVQMSQKSTGFWDPIHSFKIVLSLLDRESQDNSTMLVRIRHFLDESRV